ncbi:MAG: hypothetical protein Q9163_002293 [Psora crenata]
MPIVNPEKLIALQRNAEEVRNICILAHVDHGKTSLTDALIATNGIISPKLAGKIRYLDSRPDEQLRGITMESSAISLYFSMLRRSAPQPEPSPPDQQKKEYLINLIDSPGHIDFSSEVSTASRLCDGALVLVDAVEGVCSQTVTVLRQTWTERLKPLLVINKVDRLVMELKMSAAEAYSHLGKLLEQVNAVIGGFFQGERMEEDLLWRERVEERVNFNAQRKAASGAETVSLGQGSTDADFEEKDDEDLYFAPEKNNVVFSSAVDGWAFTVRQFATLYEKKLGIKRSLLEKVLWGDFYLDPKTKRVLGSKHLKGRALKPMFVQLVLDNIWAVYSATTGGSNGKGDPAMIEKITTSLSLKIPPHILRSKDSRAVMTTVFSAWLPLSTAILVSTVEYLPAPPAAQSTRLPALLDAAPGASHVDPKVRDAMVSFRSSKKDPLVAFVSKMVAIPESELPQNKRKGGDNMSGEEARDLARRKRAELGRLQPGMDGEMDHDLNGITEALNSADLDGHNSSEAALHPEDPEHLIGFARIFSGTLSVGDSVYALSPKFSPANPHASPEPQKITVTGLYLLMGRGLEALSSVPAGVVCGIAGLEGHILKSGTLCNQLEGAVNLAGVSMGNAPIVRVALEPANPADLDKMIRGMKLLEQSDPCAQYEVLESGEHVILTAGELHLERCLKDLRERFAKCDIQAGEPIVPYRETIVNAPEMAAPKNKDLPRGTVIGATTSNQVTVRLRVQPLPQSVTNFLGNNTKAIRRLYAERKAKNKGQGGDPAEDEHNNDEDNGVEDASAVDSGLLSLLDFREKLQAAFAEAESQESMWANVVEKITAFGPRRSGPNILIDLTPEDTCQKFLQDNSVTPDSNSGPEKGKEGKTLHPHDFSDRIVYAFQLATAQGPMCHEPMQGIAVLLESITIDAQASEADTGRLTGEVIKTVQSAIHGGFLDWSPRLMLAMYSCEIQCSTEVLGRTYSTLSRLHATITSESLKEGTPFYSITALLPLATSFNISSLLLKSTSGAAQPQLLFHGFEILDEDPFWVPQTEEELEDFGTLGDRERWSKVLVDGVRRRKGLVVKGERVVKEGEKQKTLKR